MGGAKYEDYDWKELPDEVKKAAKFLGYSKKMWNNDAEPPVSDKDWIDLTPEQQEAASVLGYTKETWDDEGCCCVIS